MSRLFPDNIRKVGLFPLSLGTQNPVYIPTVEKRLAAWKVDYVLSLPEGGEYRFLAGTDKARADSFNRLLADESIDLLFAIRGGVGAVRTLPYIDWELLLRRNIPVVGYSDMTAFLLGALKQGFRNGYSGKMAESSFGAPGTSKRMLGVCANTLCRCLEGTNISTPFKPHPKVLQAGKVKAPVVPVNLMLLISLIGTPWLPDLSGTILVVESIGQDAMQIERNLTQLQQSGILESLKGIVFATFTNCNYGKYLPEIFRDYAACVKGPAFYGFPFGHEEPASVIKVGATATLEVTRDGAVRFE